MKWVEYLRSYSFVLNHILGKLDKVVDALSMRIALLTTMFVKVVGFEAIIESHENDVDFGEAWKACK